MGFSFDVAHRDAAGVVVGTGIHLSVANTQMIVVRADDHKFIAKFRIAALNPTTHIAANDRVFAVFVGTSGNVLEETLFLEQRRQLRLFELIANVLGGQAASGAGTAFQFLSRKKLNVRPHVLRLNGTVPRWLFCYCGLRFFRRFLFGVFGP